MSASTTSATRSPRFWLTLLLLGSLLWPFAPPAAVSAAPAGGQVGDGTSGSCTEGALDAKLAGGGALTFACGGPLSIFLTSAKTITTTTSLDGAGGITLDGSGLYSIFSVNPGVSLTLRNITLNNANGGASDGGAIKNHGTLLLDHATIQGSKTDNAHSGGAIFSDGPVTIHDSLFQGNQAGSAGALFANFALAHIVITDTTFTHNHAYNSGLGYGGAIWIGQQAQVAISGGTLFSNSANYGGGLYLSAQGVLTFTASDAPAILSSNVVTTSGGGLFNSGGQATLANAAVSGNTAGSGGGLTNDLAGGLVTLTHVTLSGNRALVGGGGLYNNHGAALLANVMLSANVVTNTFSLATYGGGIENYGVLTLTDSTLSGNVATNNLGIFSFGGGLYNNAYTSQDTATLTDVTLNGNSADAGGGILNVSTLTVTNSTLSDNVATDTGGGLENYAGAASLTNVTLSGNTAGTGGGLFQQGQPPTFTLTLKNSLVASGPSGANCYEDSGSFGSLVSQGYNLSNEGTCAPYFNQTGDVNNHNPNLGPLANNGGPTFTQLPSAPSLALDAIPPGANGCGTTLTTDQRGAPRTIHGQCDIGAVEAGWPFPQLWLPLVRR